ncbi:MAG: class I SAM-dependent methyltransferase [Myxococcota bacterium]
MAATSTTTLRGTLFQEGRPCGVTLGYASNVSVYVALGASPPEPPRQFDALDVEVDSQTFRFSRCRLEPDAPEGFTGRLVFLDDVYDFRALFREKRFVDIKRSFHNLPLFLQQRERIQPAFREYTANTTFDLSVYKRFFSEQDRLCALEAPVVRDAAQRAIIRAEGPAFVRFLDQSLESLKEVTAGFDKEDHERHGFYFRRHVWEFILGSAFLARTNLKPRGYAGDSQMMQMIYENAYQGTTVFNRLLHKHPLDSAAAQAVRNRRALIAGLLRQVQERFPQRGDEPFRFMSVACGPAWELRDVVLVARDVHRLECTLLDQDPMALAAAREGIRELERMGAFQLRVNVVNESVRTMLKTPNLRDLWGRFRFIYSMGLFDYLTPPVARTVLARLYELLEPGGTLVVGNFHVGNPTRLYMEYWMDWVLYYRTEQEFLALTEGLPGADARITFEETGAQMFLQVTRRE